MLREKKSQRAMRSQGRVSNKLEKKTWAKLGAGGVIRAKSGRKLARHSTGHRGVFSITKA